MTTHQISTVSISTTRRRTRTVILLRFSAHNVYHCSRTRTWIHNFALQITSVPLNSPLKNICSCMNNEALWMTSVVPIGCFLFWKKIQCGLMENTPFLNEGLMRFKLTLNDMIKHLPVLLVENLFYVSKTFVGDAAPAIWPACQSVQRPKKGTVWFVTCLITIRYHWCICNVKHCRSRISVHEHKGMSLCTKNMQVYCSCFLDFLDFPLHTRLRFALAL